MSTWTPPLAPIEEVSATLEKLLPRVTYKQGWSFRTDGARLVITLTTPNSLNAKQEVTIHHTCPLCPWPMDERGLYRWLFEQISKVERHESMEFFRIDGHAPYFPDHHIDPYALTEKWPTPMKEIR